MATSYTEEELNLLANVPHMIDAAMAFAGNSGLFGTGKEMFVSAQSVLAGVKDYPITSSFRPCYPTCKASAVKPCKK